MACTQSRQQLKHKAADALAGQAPKFWGHNT